MSPTESIIEDAAFEWFGESDHGLGRRPNMGPGEPAEEGRFELATRISMRSSPDLLANACDSRKAMP